MAEQYTLNEALESTFDHHISEEQRSQETDSEDELEEKESVAEDCEEYNPGHKMTDEDGSRDEEDGHAKPAVTFKSKNGKLSPPETQGFQLKMS